MFFPRPLQPTLLAILCAAALCVCGPRTLETQPSDASFDGGTDALAGDGGVTGDGGDATDAAEPVYGLCEPNSDPFPIRPTVGTAPTRPFLHVDGTDVVDDNGARIALRGVNFGSWLLMENWIAGIGLLFEEDLLNMIPAKADEFGVAALVQAARDDNYLDWVSEKKPHWVLVQEWRGYTKRHAGAEQTSGVEAFWAWFDSEPWVFEERMLWRWLTARFGFAKAQELRAAFHDSYVTEIDVERVAGLGLNVIRLPVWYDALETDYVGENHFKPDGWRRIGDIALWARKHGVYLMIDLHGAPGGQSTAWHTGVENGGALWGNQKCIDKTARLWKAIAGYFADDPHVAVFDLLNEPMNVPDRDTYAAVHDRLYRAIREVDSRRIVMAEDGYRPADMLASPAEMGWENAMFSVHMYPGGASADDYLARIEAELEKIGGYWQRFGVPLFLGEFSAADGTDSGAWAAEAMDKVLATLDARGIHWTPWTWKYYAADSIWGLYHPMADPGHRIDVKEASFEEILSDFRSLDSAGFEPDPAYEQALRRNAAAPPTPLDPSN